MELMMCRSCGEFTQAVKEDGRLVPMKDGCPHCGGAEFEDAGSKETV
jgi:predicted  nucleic acid-binding Zn-ribbon protein